jgi:hypothetical protein
MFDRAVHPVLLSGWRWKEPDQRPLTDQQETNGDKKSSGEHDRCVMWMSSHTMETFSKHTNAAETQAFPFQPCACEQVCDGSCQGAYY